MHIEVLTVVDLRGEVGEKQPVSSAAARAVHCILEITFAGALSVGHVFHTRRVVLGAELSLLAAIFAIGCGIATSTVRTTFGPDGHHTLLFVLAAELARPAALRAEKWAHKTFLVGTAFTNHVHHARLLVLSAELRLPAALRSIQWAHGTSLV